MPDNKTKRVALVTGAANGFGWYTSRRLAAAGHVVIMLDRASEVSAKAEELRSSGGSAHSEVIDLMDIANVQVAIKRILEVHQRVDILINNAGTGLLRKPGGGVPQIADVDLASWNRVIALNLTTPYLLCQAVVPGMVQAGWGRIVNISSRAGRTAVPASDLSYASTKAAIIGLTRHLAAEVAPHGVTVNAIAPGRFDTVFANQSPPEVIAQAIAGIPAKRLGRPEELAATIAFLVSEDAGYMTGAVLDVNGGGFMG